MVQEAVSCFADAHVAGTRWDENGRGILTANGGNPVYLKSSEQRVSVAFSISYALNRSNGRWRVSTEQYIHKVLLNDELDIEFHWHPDEQTRVWFPHIHPRFMGSGQDHGKVHIPSGRVLIEDVLVYAYERGAQPRNKKWQSVLVKNKKDLASELTWGAPSALIYRPEDEESD